MKYSEFLNRVIDRGIEAAKKDYKGEKLHGAVRGFEECRFKDADELHDLLEKAQKATAKAHSENARDCWYWRCRELEIEWVCNCLSAVFITMNLPVIVHPTARAVIQANSVLGAEGTLEIKAEEEMPAGAPL